MKFNKVLKEALCKSLDKVAKVLTKDPIKTGMTQKKKKKFRK